MLNTINKNDLTWGFACAAPQCIWLDQVTRYINRYKPFNCATAKHVIVPSGFPLEAITMPAPLLLFAEEHLILSISVLPPKTRTFFELTLLFDRAASLGVTIMTVGLEKLSSIYELKALYGYRLGQAVRSDIERTIVLVTFSSGQLTVIYNCLYIVLEALTIFGDESWLTKEQV